MYDLFFESPAVFWNVPLWKTKWQWVEGDRTRAVGMWNPQALPSLKASKPATGCPCFLSICLIFQDICYYPFLLVSHFFTNIFLRCLSCHRRLVRLFEQGWTENWCRKQEIFVIKKPGTVTGLRTRTPESPTGGGVLHSFGVVTLCGILLCLDQVCHHRYLPWYSSAGILAGHHVLFV